MLSRLGQAARRLGQAQWRGLADVLAEGAPTASGALRQQPVSAAALRAHSSGAGGSGSSMGAAALATEAAQQAAAPEPALPGPASTSQQQQAQQAQQQAQPQQGVPEGAIDFSKRQMMMVFTCGKCNTRAVKTFAKQSYERGLVIVDCPGCHAKHLIADHLGWFGQKGTVEEFAAGKGNLVMRRLADGTTELTPEDLLGYSLANEAAAAAQAAAAAAGGEQAAAAGDDPAAGAAAGGQ